MLRHGHWPKWILLLTGADGTKYAYGPFLNYKDAEAKGREIMEQSKSVESEVIELQIQRALMDWTN